MDLYNKKLLLNNQILQSTNEQLTEANEFAEAINSSLQKPLLILDNHLKVRTVNQGFCNAFNISEAGSNEVLFSELANNVFDIAALIERLENILLNGDDAFDFEVSLNSDQVGKRTFLLNARRIIQKIQNEPLILLAFTDVTERTQKWRAEKIELQNIHVEKEKKSAELASVNQEIVLQTSVELSIANKELAFQNAEKEMRAAELSVANEELRYQNKEKEKRAAELIVANNELAFQNYEREKRAAELIIANKELEYQNNEKEKRAAELFVANNELAFQNDEKEKRAAELIIANKELAFQNDEKEKRAAELIVANKELAFQNTEKEKRASELKIANEELRFQNKEKEKRAAELFVANNELAFQNDEKEKRAAELIIANTELAFQNSEKEKRAAELIIANEELRFQYNEKEKRASELIIANNELAFQNEEKEKRAAELFIANKELAFQNSEKEKRAAELIIANKELRFQYNEKENRASELIVANKELAFQNEEKEKRAVELSNANRDLTTFTYVSSHDLQEPLRKIQNFVTMLLTQEESVLSDEGKHYLKRMDETAKRMKSLIEDLLAYSRSKSAERKFETVMLKLQIDQITSDFIDSISLRGGSFKVGDLNEASIIPFQFRQLFSNLINNSLKFSSSERPPEITITSDIVSNVVWPDNLNPERMEYCHIIYQDNGIGFDPQYSERIFEVFQRLHSQEEYKGTGMGLAICKRIMENHHGNIVASGELDKGARFDIYFPLKQ